MDHRQDIAEDWHAALAALAWQVDLGVTEASGDAPVSAYDLPEEAAWSKRAGSERDVPAAPAARRPIAESPGSLGVAPALDAAQHAAQHAASGAATLDALRDALVAYEQCELKRGARSLVFGAGNAGARVMILATAPGRDDDIEGRPFSGAAGLLLDRMFAAIGLARGTPDPASALYLTHAVPWRPPQDRDPDAAEIAMLRPFLERHVALVAPEVVVVMGTVALAALTGAQGPLPKRGVWTTAAGRAVLPMFHPLHLLRHPICKREAWADLLALRKRLG